MFFRSTLSYALPLVLALCVPSLGHAQDLVINEVMSSNSTLRDEDGATPDWFEFYNAGATTLNLEGYGVSDGTNPLEWVFPAVSIEPGAHLLVFASGKDRTDGAAHWETVIDAGDTWQYLIPNSEPASAWRLPSFNAAGWSAGATGIGYGDDDDVTIVPTGTVSVYARKTFDIGDPDQVSRIFFDIDFDDAFVAFLNGVEIARENIADLGRPPLFNEVADGFTEPQLIFGGEAFHYDVSGEQGVLRAGENVLAIQLHNTGSGSSDLSLIPYLTLAFESAPAGARGVAEVPRRHIPALHTSFRLGAGETLTLTSDQMELLDAVLVPDVPANVSTGRFPDGADDWRFHVEGTPGTSNADPGFTDVSGPVQFSHSAGYYDASFSLVLSADDPATPIYYTLDGSEPTTGSSRYTSAIAISSTSVVRAKALLPGAIPGPTATHTYLIDETITLPVVSISTAPENFFDTDVGIYVLGDSYESNFPHFGANFWEDWERPIHLELIEPDGTVGLSQPCGTKIFGGWSRGNPQRSLGFFARSRYGPGKFRYRIFPDKQIDSFESFIIRNSGNDWQRAHFRDAMMTSLLEHVDVDRQSYRPAVVFINAEYWGIMNLREKVNEHYIEANHRDVSSNQIDLLERNTVAIHGDTDHYRALTTLVDTSDLSRPEVYDQVRTMVNIENFIDYHAAQIYFDNTDWPGNNIKFWRPRTPDGRWRWVLFDTDFGFGIWNAANYNNNTLAFALEPNGPGWPNPPWSTLLLRRLVANQDFVHDFANRFATHLNTIFHSSAVLRRINEMEDVLEPEILRQRQRWGGSVTDWRSQVSVMRNFATRRISPMRSHLASRFALGANAALRVDVAPANSGEVEVHGLPLIRYPFLGNYFRELPVDLRAKPLPGYRFLGWTGDRPSANAEQTVSLGAGTVDVTAHFDIDCEALSDVVINEINYHAAPATDPGDWAELYNPHPFTVDLSGWSLRDEQPDHVFTLPPGTVLESDQYLVVCSNAITFAARFPTATGFIGDLGFQLANGGELLELVDDRGVVVDSVLYEDEDPWPAAADGQGATLALTNPVLGNTHPGFWTASPDGGTPGERNSDIFVEVDADCGIRETRFLRGDCNADAVLDISDAVCVLFWLFLGADEPQCLAPVNANGDLAIDVSDGIVILEYLFVGGAPLPEPFATCGVPTLPIDETLGCANRPRACP